MKEEKKTRTGSTKPDDERWACTAAVAADSNVWEACKTPNGASGNFKGAVLGASTKRLHSNSTCVQRRRTIGVIRVQSERAQVKMSTDVSGWC